MTELSEIIRAGENINVEFKSNAVHTDSLAKEIVAFANSYGGTLYLGVEDDGTVTGISAEKKWDEFIANIARNNVTPPLNPQIAFAEFSGKTIAIVEIAKGKNKPYQTAKDGKYWIRVASTVRQASPPELLRLFQASGFMHYDNNPVANTGFDVLNQKKLRLYFNDCYQFDWDGEDNKIQLLLNSNILTHHEEKIVCTVGGLLVFCDYPERYLPQATIQLAVIKGTEITDSVVQKKEITGTLPDQIDNAQALIKLYLPEPLVVKDSAKREDTLAIPGAVLREAVVNAVCHRDYAMSTSRIHIYIYTDRLEIKSPGRLANALDLEKIRHGNSAPRNLFLLKLLDNLHYIDGLGRGIPLMLRLLKSRISFTEVGEFFTVKIAILPDECVS